MVFRFFLYKPVDKKKIYATIITVIIIDYEIV